MKSVKKLLKNLVYFLLNVLNLRIKDIFLGVFIISAWWGMLLLKYQEPAALIQSLYWHCHIAFLILGITFFFKTERFSTIILVVTIPMQFLWIVDAVGELFGVSLLARSPNAGEPIPFLLSLIVSYAIHILTPVFAFYRVWQIKFQPCYWLMVKLVGILSFISFGLNILLERNINCLLYSCDINITYQEFIASNPLDYQQLFAFSLLKNLVFWFIVFSAWYFVWKWIFKKLNRVQPPQNQTTS